MPKLVLTDAVVTVGGTDISNHVSEVTIETTRPEVDVTSMGDANTEVVPGIGDATITLTVFQDYQAASIDAIMFPLSTTKTPSTITVKPTSAAVSTSNPLYSMSGLLYSYSPIAGGVGAAATTTLTFRNAAQAGLTRATV